MLKSLFHKMYMNAHAHNTRNIMNMFDDNPSARIMDLGCYDGDWTQKMSDKIGASNMEGVEILPEPAKEAKAKGIKVHDFDLNLRNWPLESESYDVVHSSFVIEHVFEIDVFVAEIFRILKPGGYVITSTENGSSWHNIFAAVLGWQTFSSACCSTKQLGLGNPIAIHRGKQDVEPSMTHKVIFNYLGLKEIHEVHGYKDVKIKGAGYYPLPSTIGAIDPRHSHFITTKATKPA